MSCITVYAFPSHPTETKVIADPYLLVLNVPLHRHQGRYWADPLWRKDLEAHLDQIADLSIACPVRREKPPAGWEALSRPGIRVHPLPVMGRLSYLMVPYLVVRLWRIMSAAAIVHTGVAGWPFPLGWIAIPIARLRHRFIVVVVESAFWRIPRGMVPSSFARLRTSVYEAINKALVQRCDVGFFTTQAYKDELHAKDASTSHVLPAVWIDDEQLILESDLAALAPSKGCRLLFAGRLTTAKGVAVLLDAIRQSRVPVDIIGEGDLRDAIVAAQRDSPELVRLLDPIDYGPAFFSLLDEYAALIVPTISDEQPRIIFDAFARGIPVLASATSGNRQIVEHGRNGILFEPNDIAGLADALVAALRDPAQLRTMGTTARRTMATQTHAAMHATRARTIANALASR